MLYLCAMSPKYFKKMADPWSLILRPLLFGPAHGQCVQHAPQPIEPWTTSEGLDVYSVNLKAAGITNMDEMLYRNDTEFAAMLDTFMERPSSCRFRQAINISVEFADVGAPAGKGWVDGDLSPTNYHRWARVQQLVDEAEGKKEMRITPTARPGAQAAVAECGDDNARHAEFLGRLFPIPRGLAIALGSHRSMIEGARRRFREARITTRSYNDPGGGRVNDEYVGHMKDEFRHGEGTYRAADWSYTGQWKYGLQHGWGEWIGEDGWWHKGTYSHGKKHGPGFAQMPFNGIGTSGVWDMGNLVRDEETVDKANAKDAKKKVKEGDEIQVSLHVVTYTHIARLT
jgi:hypothetical protein